MNVKPNTRPRLVSTAFALAAAVGAVAAATAANAASALDGDPIVAVRYSGRDPRDRHRGVSHHTRVVVDLSLGEPAVAWPRGLDPPDWLRERVEEVDVDGWQDACARLPLEHMQRRPDEDPWFFAAAFAAGRLARDRLA
jgi:hypothetical protein